MSQASTDYYGENGHQAPAYAGDNGYGYGYAGEHRSGAAADGYVEYAAETDQALPSLVRDAYIPRSKALALPLLLPMALCGLSYAAGGVPFVTDLGFIMLAVICAACLLRELIVFPFRFGVGGVLLFGGTLLWFCYDYFNNWMGIDFGGAPTKPWVVAKGAYFHVIFVTFMVLGLQINKGRWLEKVMHAVPEPNGRNIYFALVLITFVIGMIPFLFFTEEPFYVAIWKSFWGGRSGSGASFTAGRTGNLNYSWGGYLAQLADVGMMGAVLAAFHAIIVARQLWQKVVCWFIWGLWVGIAFGTGTRGFTVFLALPVILLVFLKYSQRASMLMRRISVRAYATSAAVALAILLLVQVQGAFRNEGFTADKFHEVEVSKLTGNEMFTTTLLGMEVFPEQKPFFFERIPGQGLVRLVPEELFWLVIGPVPRALWTSKPVSEVNTWYNNAVTGGTRGAEGTTISNGSVGHPYIRYGPFGVPVFGLFYGWMMGVTERSLAKAMNRPMALLFTLAFATFIFRCFRDLWWHNLYPVMIAGVAMTAVVWVSNTFFGGGDGGGAPEEPAGAPGTQAPGIA